MEGKVLDTSNLEDLLARLRSIEQDLIAGKYVKTDDFKGLLKSMEELERQLNSLDRTYENDKIKNKQLFDTVNDLSQQLKALQDSDQDRSDNRKAFAEKAVLGAIGVAIPYILGRFLN